MQAEIAAHGAFVHGQQGRGLGAVQGAAPAQAHQQFHLVLPDPGGGLFNGRRGGVQLGLVIEQGFHARALEGSHQRRMDARVHQAFVRDHGHRAAAEAQNLVTQFRRDAPAVHHPLNSLETRKHSLALLLILK